MQHTQQAGEQGFVAGGKRIPVDCEVRTWLETGLQFRGRPARKLSELVVLHWTGAENPPSAVHRNMVEVGYAVHFVIDQFGIAWQMLDTDRLGAHAKGVNERAIGIEIICRGDDKKVPTRGVERLERTEVIQGREVTYAAFTPEQEATAVTLVTALCAHYRLPLLLPPCDGVLSRSGLRGFRGVCGHLHVRRTKHDPGLYLLRLVAQHRDTLSGGEVT